MPHATQNSIGQDGPLNDPIAIVGMSCTLAGGVDTPTALWETLLSKSIKQSAKIPESRFNVDAYFHDKAFGRPAAIGSRGGFFLDTELTAFDADFFGYEADEAMHMDPQHFRVLESVYECLESAGRTKEEIRGTNTAVYIGNFSLDQVIKSARHSYDDRHLHEVIGIDPGLLSSRVSYCYDLNGPVFSTNTGCTSSLFALHTAAMALRSGECSSAIVGGVNLLQGPEAYSSYSKFGIMSPDSMCHSFDARCNGYVRGEGVGALYVRRLSDAIRDNDPIRGVIRTIAVNNNGTVPGVPMFVPNAQGLEKSIRLAYLQSKLDHYDTAFVETHGIGMVLGEIAEAHALGKAMNEPRPRKRPILLGSLKPNFGHQEAASGIFVLIKSAMMTEAGIIPGHTGFEKPHPAIDLEKLNIKVQSETIPWPEEYSTRRVGFCSYGWSGTNAHGLVESVEMLHPEYKLGRARKLAKYDHSTTRPLLVTFSAHKESSLRKNITKHRLVADDFFAADLAYTLNVRRSRFSHRAFGIMRDDGSAADALSDSALKFGSTGKEGKAVKVCFSFPPKPESEKLRFLAQELLGLFPVFVNSIKRLENLLRETNSGGDVKLEGSLRDPAKELTTAHDIAVQIALIDLLADWNIEPTVVLKQRSRSDDAAGYAAGTMSAGKALGVEYSRSSSDWCRAKPADVILTDDESSPGTKTDVMIQIGSVEEGTIGIDDITTLLEAAGQLYLHGHPVNLEKVNAVPGTDWTPSMVVDLPAYQWDHSNKYSAETMANKQHRLNKHPYHDLLGRRVYGLSPQTMIWKNKLSFRDLPDSIPWVPNAKPLTVHGADDFMCMIYEALHQGFDGQQIRVDNFFLRDIVITRELRYKEDCDLIELQTTFTQLSKTASVTSYRVIIESVKEEAWTTHCEATVLLEAAVDKPNGVVEANATHRSDINGSHTREEQGEGEQDEVELNLDHKESGCAYQIQPSVLAACLRFATDSQPAKTGEGVSSSRIGELRLFKTQEHVQGDKGLVRRIPGGGIEARDGKGELILEIGGIGA